MGSSGSLNHPGSCLNGVNQIMRYQRRPLMGGMSRSVVAAGGSVRGLCPGRWVGVCMREPYPQEEPIVAAGYVRSVTEILTLLAVTLAVIAVALMVVRGGFAARRHRFSGPLTGVIGVILSLLLVRPFLGDVAAGFTGLVIIIAAFYFRAFLRDRDRLPMYFLTPAMAGMVVLFFYPLFYEFWLAFTDLSLGTFKGWIRDGGVPWVGLENFREVFRDRATGSSFPAVLWQTVVWTVVNVFFHVVIGTGLALLLNQEGMRGAGLYRTILILPWVIPQVILVLVWRSEFSGSVGLINQIIQVTNQLVSFEWNGSVIAPLTWMGFVPRQWFTEGSSLFAACCLVNIWLGVPFMMVNALGALQSIPRSIYEAASIDGIGRASVFFHLTLPQLKPVMVPVILLGFIWTFNNLTVIFLMTDGGRYEGADILVTDLYKQSFTYYRYGFAAAYAWVIFAVLGLLIFLQFRMARTSEPGKVAA